MQPETEPAPADPPEAEAAKGVPTGGDPDGPAPGRRAAWLIAVLALGLIAAGGAAYLWSRGGDAAPPGSVQALRELIIDPGSWPTSAAGQLGAAPVPAELATVFSTATAGPDDGATAVGLRWTVDARADDSSGGTNVAGYAQYDTPAHAVAALDTFRQQVGDTGPEEAVPGRRNVYLYPEADLGGGTPSRIGMGVKGTVLVLLTSQAESPESLRRLLTDQLDRLP